LSWCIVLLIHDASSLTLIQYILAVSKGIWLVS